MGKVTVTVLGAGDAFGSGGQLNAGYVVETEKMFVLIDAGPSILSALKRNSIAPSKLNLVLITHLHGDHFAGLPFLILEYLYQSPLRHTLTIAGPSNLAARTWKLFRTMYPRTDPTAVAKKLRFVVLKPGTTIKFGPISVDALRTPHTVRDTSLALKLTLDGKRLVFSGDTGWTDELLRFTAATDLTFLECTLFKGRADSHISYAQLLKKRNEFRTHRLILTHLGQEVFERRQELEFETAFDGLKVYF